MSRGFICAVVGVAVTLLGWFGSWAWPTMPAFAVLHLAFGSGENWLELPFAGRAAVLVGLIVVNVGFWALLAYVLLRSAQSSDGVAGR